MRAPILVAAALFAGTLAACSKPAQDTGSTAGTDAATPALPGAEAQVVSALEAGHDPNFTVPRSAAPPVTRRSAPAPERAAEARVEHVHGPEMAEAAPAVSVTPTSAGAAPLSVNLAFLPGAPAPASAATADAGSGDTGARRAPGERGPAIIIRGGSGRPDDDCDLHNGGLRPARGVGIAINSLAPSTRPYRTGGHGSGFFPAGTRIR